ncbi:hypothetical protein PUN28_002424 [Cardiocondyla obscurior]|uniref:Borealin n=1 Tax=Cardiocondyla obscurior TaxID=286306 RepID=A0AAW2GU25_9HYME
MPRTKRAKTASELTKECDMAVKTFERHMQHRIAKMERDAQSNLKGFEAFISITISRLPPEISRMTLGEIISWESHDNQKENRKRNDEVSSSVTDEYMQPPAVPKPRKAKAGKRAVTGTSDDGYATDRTSKSSISQSVKRQAQVSSTLRTRSITRASRAKLSEINQMTPCLKVPNNVYNVVTPKVKPNTPLNVLRRPRQGEMVLSMQGSPLLVSAVVEEKTANINVPLANGNVMSLLPQEGLRMSNIPPLDSETMHQLETLKSHIEKVISLK